MPPAPPVPPPPVSPVPVVAPPVTPAAPPTVSPPESGGKFKLKPKAQAPAAGASPAAPPPPVSTAQNEAASPAAGLPPPLPPPAAEGQKAPPPFPVVAPPKTGKTAPPIPHVSVKTELPEPEVPESAAVTAANAKAIAKKKRTVLIGAGLAAALVCGGLSYFAVRMFLTPEPPPPPPPAAKAKAPAPSPTVAVVSTPAPAPAAPTAAATPGSIAHIPANAINKAKAAVDARNASGQSNVDSALTGDPIADKPAIGTGASPASKAPVARPAATAKTAVTAGVSATTELEQAAVEASPEFRSYVANAKIAGVFQGSPARALINGRMARTGEMVEPSLGITFEGYDPAKRHLSFKDKSGAVVVRKY
jgi:hypothetical protein